MTWEDVHHTDVVIPSEPSAMAGINVHDDVGQIELLESICDALFVPCSRVLAGGEVGVCDQVWKRIRLDNEGNRRVWVGKEDLANCYAWLADKNAPRSFTTYDRCTRTCNGR